MIGIFDSGLGGLSALKEVRRLLPSEDIVYFGDTGRVPYGSRSKETITKYALQDLNFLMSKQVDAVLVACGTISSIAIDTLRNKYPSIPIIGVVDSAAEVAVSLTKNKKIGVIATSSTIGSHSFEKKLLSLDNELDIIQTACPLFVPLVENGFISPDNEVTHLVAKQYLAEIKASGADTLILGCTHYPIITESIARVLPGVNIVSSSKAAADTLSQMVQPTEINRLGNTEYYVSDEPYGFEKTASIFLETKIHDKVTRIDIEKY
ncbi:MAG: glutamate racemase [Clostridiales bacterium]|nr:glutamate racemase [Clostridiales bacterium]